MSAPGWNRMDRVEDCISFLIGKAGQQIARRARESWPPTA